MERIDKILNHPLFIEGLEQIRAAEADRRFCRHDMVHFLDVARIAMIVNLEENRGVEREWIYAAALLHDIGRHIQYRDGTPHELAGARIASGILADCGFEDKETAVITEAVRGHKNSESAGEAGLSGLLYRADKASRPCFCCKAEKECGWKKEKKNLSLRY